MPRYDFKCPDGHVVEREFRMAEVPDTVECGGPNFINPCPYRAERQISWGGKFILNKVMAPPSQRMKNYDIGV